MSIEQSIAEALRQVVREEIRAAFAEARAAEDAEDAKRLVGVPEAALRLGLSRSTVYKLSERFEIPNVKIGTSLRFRVADLDAYKDARRRSRAVVTRLAAAAGHR